MVEVRRPKHAITRRTYHMQNQEYLFGIKLRHRLRC
jgi:hypothetical protein